MAKLYRNWLSEVTYISWMR